MKFQVLINMMKQGFQGMWRNRGMGVASVASIAAVLMILGIVLVLILSINNIVINTRAQFDQIDVFLEDDISDEEIASIEETVLENEGVSAVEYKSREEDIKKTVESINKQVDYVIIVNNDSSKYDYNMFENVYNRMSVRDNQSYMVIEKLYNYFCAHPELLPNEYKLLLDDWDNKLVVSDYIAGMTDNYCVGLFNDIFMPV